MADVIVTAAVILTRQARDGLEELAAHLRSYSQQMYANRVQAVVDAWDQEAEGAVLLQQCFNCGTYLEVGALSCDSCGKAQPAALAAMERAQAAQQVAAAATPPAPEPPEGAHLTQCQACPQTIFFAHMRKKDGSMGKPTPVNWPPIPGTGHLRLLPELHDGKPALRQTTMIERTEAAAAGVQLYTGHFSTCPEADEFRRK